MSTYLDNIASQIRAEAAGVALPAGDVEALFRLYAVVCLTRGANTTSADVHHAWVAWMLEQDPRHPSLVPLSDLDASTVAADEPFAAAIRRVARRAPVDDVSSALMPGGPPSDAASALQFYEQYKLIVASSEALVARRQQVNTFFLTITGAVLTAAALFLRGGGAHVRLQAAGIAVLGITGLVLAIAWRSLIRSFGQLNTGKFAVINRMEQHLAAGIYEAEWRALREGKDPKVYRSFTSREVWVPNTLIAVYSVTAIIAALAWAGVIVLH